MEKIIFSDIIFECGQPDCRQAGVMNVVNVMNVANVVNVMNVVNVFREPAKTGAKVAVKPEKMEGSAKFVHNFWQAKSTFDGKFF